MTYIRHRHRMIAASVVADLEDTLIACRWRAGTTAFTVRTPTIGSDSAVVSTSPGDVFASVQDAPVNVIEFFPEATGTAPPGPTPLNTLAVSTGSPGDPAPLELGSRSEIRPYTFDLALYASSDAVAESLLGDLDDRYKGFHVNPEVIPLWNYLGDDVSSPVGYLDVESFRYTRNTDAVAPAEVHLFFAELNLLDYVYIDG